MNTQGKWDLKLAFEKEYGRPPTHQEITEIMGETKLRKTAAAKSADEVGNVEQAKRWRSALDAAGLRIDIARPGKPVERRSLDDRVDELFARLERPTGIATAVDADALFGSDAILPAVYQAAEGLGFTTDQISLIAGIYQESHLVEVPLNEERTVFAYTTQGILDNESQVLDRLRAKDAQIVEAPRTFYVEKALRSAEAPLDGEQQELMRVICSDRAVVHGVGPAGCGKNFAIKPAVDALRESKVVNKVIVVAVSRKRANETAEKIGADSGWTPEALELAHKKGWTADDKTLVIFDEIAMANTFNMAATLDAIGEARLVSIGDEFQSPPIGPAGWLRFAHQMHPPIELTHVYRQKDHRDRAAFQMLRDGDAEGALINLANRDRVFVAEDPQDLVATVQERYEHHTTEGKKPEEIAIINTGHNSVLDDMNRMVQRVRLEHGQLDEAQRYEVQETSSGRRWQLYRHDRVVFNAGVYDGLSEPILNGTTATVVRMTPDGGCRVEIEHPKRRTVTVHLKPEAHTQPIVPAYCMSTNKWQGGEVSVNLVIPGSPDIASLNSGYSALTRGVDVTEVILDKETWGDQPVRTLGPAWAHAVEKQTASHYLDLFGSDDDLDVDETQHEQVHIDERFQEMRAELGLGGGLHL